MRISKVTGLLIAGALVAGSGHMLRAGGLLDDIDITGFTASPRPGEIVANVVGIRWDTRAIPVRYSMNTTIDPVPNPLGAPLLTVAQARSALQGALDQWNDIPTSFIDMRIVNTTANPGAAGFDMVNELTFRSDASFGAIAVSPSVTLIADVELVAGDDIDGDGDSDVTDGIASARDTDGDGDIEFPSGEYKAGTILENDVLFNTKTTNGYRFTVGDAALDTAARSVDLTTVAVHEFGHSHGLSHSAQNESSDTDGDGATMFPFIDTTDPFAELQQRMLGSDDLAWSSYAYPEGTGKKGPAALQPGDVKFDRVYGLITGKVRHGILDEDVAGANVFAVDRRTDRIVSSGFSGTTRLSFNPATGALFVVPGFSIVNGKYAVPVPRGSYTVGIEAVDGQPTAAGNISFTAQVGAILGQLNFNEEYYNGRQEDAVEVRPGRGTPVQVVPGHEARTAFVTGATFNVNNFGSRDFVGFTGVAPGTYYAVQVPAAQLAAIAPGEPLSAHAMAFNTLVANASVTARFAEAVLTTGTVDAAGVATLDLANPLARVSGFVGQDNDFSPLYFPNPRQLGRRIRNGVASGQIENLFMVLRLPTTAPFPGVSGLPPLIGLDGGVAANDVPILGLSYTSTDGVAFTRVANFNFMFSLILSERP